MTTAKELLEAFDEFWGEAADTPAGRASKSFFLSSLRKAQEAVRPWENAVPNSVGMDVLKTYSSNVKKFWEGVE